MSFNIYIYNVLPKILYANCIALAIVPSWTVLLSWAKRAPMRPTIRMDAMAGLFAALAPGLSSKHQKVNADIQHCMLILWEFK